MPPSAEEAAQALRDIAVINERAAGFYDYQAESDQLVLWGAAHVIGFSLSALFPQHLLLIWGPLILMSMLGGALLARRASPHVPGITWRYLALVCAIMTFHIVLNILTAPTVPEQGALFAPLFVCTLYILRGLQLRPRYLVVGVLTATLSLVGYAFFMPWFWWWMALAYGGTFVAFGLWLRRI